MPIIGGILKTSVALSGVYRVITTAVLIGVTVYSLYDGIRSFKQRNKLK